MAKFYIKCGSFQFLTTAQDARGAALWALHHYLSQHVDLAAIEWARPSMFEGFDCIQALISLDDLLVASELGFGHEDAGLFDTAELIREWSQLLVAVARLEAQILAEAS